MSGYERENRNVLRRCLKTASDGAAVTWVVVVVVVIIVVIIIVVIIVIIIIIINIIIHCKSILKCQSNWSLLNSAGRDLKLSTFIVIYIQVVGSWEDRDERWKPGRLTFSVHAISVTTQRHTDIHTQTHTETNHSSSAASFADQVSLFQLLSVVYNDAAANITTVSKSKVRESKLIMWLIVKKLQCL